jgi:antitoxin PrlF
MTSTITSKGQLTIPKNIRDRLHLQTGDKVEFIVDDEGGVRMIPLTVSLTSLKGMVPKPEKIVTLKEMREAIEKES